MSLLVSLRRGYVGRRIPHHDVRCLSSGNDRRRVLDGQRRRQLETYDDDDGLVGHGHGVATAREASGSMNPLVGVDQSWDAWNDYFMEMDEIVRELHGLDDDVEDAVKKEDYQRAAELKREQCALESRDTVLEIQRELEAAVGEERYSDAAVLRDMGGARLLGWWIGKEGSGDAQGHVVAITRDFSRYVAHAYTGYTLARAVGWTKDVSPEISLDAVVMSNEEEMEEEEDGGTPVFEIFYKRREDGTGWQHQAAVFNSPVESMSSGDVVSIIDDNGIDHDSGTDFVQINLSGTHHHHHDDDHDDDEEEEEDDDDDAIRTIDDLVNSLDGSDSDGEEDTEELFSALSEMSNLLSKRVPADLEWIDKDNFALVVDERKQKEIIDVSTRAVQEDADQPETLKEIENMVKAALSSTGATVNMIDDVQERSEEIGPSIAGLEGKVTYTRLVPPTVTTDVFQGLYLGSFGPHGPEIIEIKRVRLDGQEWVQGVKITGDINVPAGEVSFKARVGRENRLSPDGVYPMEYGVQARYPGQGRVAREGFSSPKWVDGELLTLTRSNALTRGADVGFVFHVDASKKFLLLFERIDDSIFLNC